MAQSIYSVRFPMKKWWIFPVRFLYVYQAGLMLCDVVHPRDNGPMPVNHQPFLYESPQGHCPVASPEGCTTRNNRVTLVVICYIAMENGP